MEISVISAMISRYVSNSWRINAQRATTANSGTSTKAVQTTTWVSVFWENLAKISTLSGNFVGTIWTGTAKKGGNALITIQKFLFKKTSSSPKFYISIFSSTSQLTMFATTAPKSVIKSPNVLKELKLKKRMSSSVVYAEMHTASLMTATLSFDATMILYNLLNKLWFYIFFTTFLLNLFFIFNWHKNIKSTVFWKKTSNEIK